MGQPDLDAPGRRADGAVGGLLDLRQPRGGSGQHQRHAVRRTHVGARAPRLRPGGRSGSRPGTPRAPRRCRRSRAARCPPPGGRRRRPRVGPVGKRDRAVASAWCGRDRARASNPSTSGGRCGVCGSPATYLMLGRAPSRVDGTKGRRESCQHRSRKRHRYDLIRESLRRGQHRHPPRRLGPDREWRSSTSTARDKFIVRDANLGRVIDIPRDGTGGAGRQPASIPTTLSSLARPC